MHKKRGAGEEMNSVSVLQSEKKVVDVTGIEPVTLACKDGWHANQTI